MRASSPFYAAKSEFMSKFPQFMSNFFDLCGKLEDLCAKRTFLTKTGTPALEVPASFKKMGLLHSYYHHDLGT